MAGISTELRELQDQYIKKSFKYGKDVQESEVIDILSDYTWNAEDVIAGGSSIGLDGSATGASQRTNVPFCYVAERKSAAHAGIANIFNVLNATSQSVDKLLDLFGISTGSEQKQEESSPSSSSIDSLTSKLKEFVNGKKDNLLKLLSQNNLSGNDLFAPYKYLYITKETKKKFVFPLLNNVSSFTEINNTWGSTEKLPGVIQLAMDAFYDMADMLSVGANLAEGAVGLVDGKGGTNIGRVREIAKSFTYPEDGDTVAANFTLYNTTKVDAWKDNYKFLYLFGLRNLPLRIDATSYLPPMLYDVIVPGTKRLPVCAVSNMSIEPKGMTRVLKCENFLGKGEVPVNVPEAWEVTITFKSLIGHSANLILAGLYNGLNVSASSSNGNLY